MDGGYTFLSLLGSAFIHSSTCGNISLFNFLLKEFPKELPTGLLQPDTKATLLNTAITLLTKTSEFAKTEHAAQAIASISSEKDIQNELKACAHPNVKMTLRYYEAKHELKKFETAKKTEIAGILFDALASISRHVVFHSDEIRCREAAYLLEKYQTYRRLQLSDAKRDVKLDNCPYANFLLGVYYEEKKSPEAKDYFQQAGILREVAPHYKCDEKTPSAPPRVMPPSPTAAASAPISLAPPAKSAAVKLDKVEKTKDTPKESPRPFDTLFKTDFKTANDVQIDELVNQMGYKSGFFSSRQVGLFKVIEQYVEEGNVLATDWLFRYQVHRYPHGEVNLPCFLSTWMPHLFGLACRSGSLEFISYLFDRVQEGWWRRYSDNYLDAPKCGLTNFKKDYPPFNNPDLASGFYPPLAIAAAHNRKDIIEKYAHYFVPLEKLDSNYTHQRSSCYQALKYKNDECLYFLMPHIVHMRSNPSLYEILLRDFPDTSVRSYLLYSQACCALYFAETIKNAPEHLMYLGFSYREKRVFLINSQPNAKVHKKFHEYRLPDVDVDRKVIAASAPPLDPPAKGEAPVFAVAASAPLLTPTPPSAPSLVPDAKINSTTARLHSVIPVSSFMDAPVKSETGLGSLSNEELLKQLDETENRLARLRAEVSARGLLVPLSLALLPPPPAYSATVVVDETELEPGAALGSL